MTDAWPDALFAVARFAAGAYFVWSGSSKLGAPATFWRQVMDYRIVGPRSSRAIAAGVPPAEFIAGLFFAAGVLPIAMGIALLCLLAVFTVAIISSLSRRLDNECGCGAGTARVSPWLVVRNVGLATLVVAGFFSTPPTYVGLWFVAAAGAATAVAITVVRFKVLSR